MRMACSTEPRMSLPPPPLDRSPGGTIDRQYGRMLIKELRSRFGRDFAPNISGEIKLGRVLELIDDDSLAKLALR